ncbi:MAG: DUF92 domain-containing protein [Bacteroidetes bacterium]|nr:DUF92 domain-containing protein [Bacteroidota bacterium]
MPIVQQDIITALIIAGIAVFVALFQLILAGQQKFLSPLLQNMLQLAAVCGITWAEVYSINHTFFSSICFIISTVVFLSNYMWGKRIRQFDLARKLSFLLLATSVLSISSFCSTVQIALGIFVAGIADAVAGILYHFLGNQSIIFLFEKRSWTGLLSFYLTAVFITSICFEYFSFHGILMALTFAVLPALTWLFSYKSIELFSVPIVTVTCLFNLPFFSTEDLLRTWVALFAFMLLSFLALHKKWLNPGGAVAACWTGTMLWINGGITAFVVPGIFLIGGSLFSKLNNTEREKEGRSAVQVFANGLIGIIFLCGYTLTGNQNWLLSYLASFCISMSDTASSEWGVFLKGKVVDIIGLKSLPPGVSGGVSFAGTIAGLLGAAILAFIGVYTYQLSRNIFFLLTLTGFAGMIADSILGSLLQVKYRSPAGSIADAPANGAFHWKGFSWCTNDMVNILSNALVSAVFFYFFA